MYFCLNRGTAGGGLPHDQFCRLAAGAGFQGADVDFGHAVAHGVNALADLFAKNNLRYGGWAPGDWRGDLTTHTADLAVLDFHAGAALKVKADHCCTHIMPSSDKPFLENWRFHVERLGAVARTLAGHGLRLGLEFVAPLHHRHSGRHEFIFTPGQLLELAADIGPNVGLLVDIFHLHAAGESMGRPAKIDAKKIVLVHLNDAPPGALDKIHDFTRLLPGEGVLDQTAFLQALKTAGYDGPVSVETFSEDLKALPPELAAKRAWDATQRVAHLAGVL